MIDYKLFFYLKTLKLKALLYSTRLKFMLWMYNWSQFVYVEFFKRSKIAWAVTQQELQFYPDGSLGIELHHFLQQHNFDLMAKLERHDIYHILTETGTEIENEIAMQYLLCGNGKRSLYMASMIGIGTIVFPEYIKLYFKKYQQGKQFKQLDNFQFENLLHTNINIIKQKIKRT